jgi:succinate-semialdehyde dehydrogenase/glutarate-semialdehyde dehydrogenase
LEYLDPATGRKIGAIVPSTYEDVVAAHSAASLAWETWKQTSLHDRLQHLLKGQKWLIQNIDEVIDIISLNNGKPRTESMMADIAPVIWAINYLIQESPRILKSKNISVSRWVHWKRAKQHFLPLGVVGIISPWNYPFSIPMGEILTALVAGNCVILKPSEVTSGVNKVIRRFFEACELPKGVFQ